MPKKKVTKSSDSKKSKQKEIVITSDSESDSDKVLLKSDAFDSEIKKEKPAKIYDNYKDACNKDLNNFYIS